MSIRVKKYKNNEYALTKSGIWVRNPTNNSYPIDINNFTTESDKKLFIDNEIKSKSLNLMMLDDLKIKSRNCVIISDGYDFINKQLLLKNIKQPYLVIGINSILKKWDVKNGKIDYYVVNNPYEECCSYLPNVRYFPNCIAATRTSVNFLKKYKGNIFKYVPTYDNKFVGLDKNHSFKIDDYRNPLCAAVNIAYFFKADKILLLCCDDTFKDFRPGSINVNDNLFSYPQHKINHEIVDELANFMIHHDNYIKLADHSNTWKYTNIPYIAEDEISNFFDD